MEIVKDTWEKLVLSSDQYWIIFIVIPFLQHQIVFWGYSYFLMFMEHLYNKNKIQKIYINSSDFAKCVRLVLSNQFFILLPSHILGYWLLKDRYGVERLSTTFFPPWYTVIFQVLFCILVEEIVFYYSHRLLHYGTFYANIHKIHHNFKAPTGIASEYAHPIEYIVGDLIPVMIGPAILNCHIFVTWIWYFVAIVGTISHHCGYLFPWLIGGLNPLFHDYHHYSFIANFGLLGILDKLHGTDRGFNEWKLKVKVN